MFGKGFGSRYTSLYTTPSHHHPQACICVHFVSFGSLSTSPSGDESVTQPIVSQSVYLHFSHVLLVFLAVFLGAMCQCTGGVLANQRQLGHPGETWSKLQQGPQR